MSDSAIYEVGKYYTVPCVWWNLRHWKPAWWPVFGPEHDDAEIIDFPYRHWHIDARFVSDKQFKQLCKIHRMGVFSIVAHTIDKPTDKSLRLEVRMRKLRCERQVETYPAFSPWLSELQTAYRSLRLGDRDVCPHRGASLESLPSDDNGCVTCPLHGLRWCRKTRKLKPYTTQEMKAACKRKWEWRE